MFYEQLAAEYYDATAHPTCRNFRVASACILKKWLQLIARSARKCEVGCGQSLCAELLYQDGHALTDLWLVDSSASMLAYSRKWEQFGAKLIESDVASVPVPDEHFGAVVSVLGDPYNTDAFWAEARRIVEVGGYVVFTTPSFEWSSRYRTSINGGDTRQALFETRSGRQLYVPSIVVPVDEQLSQLESHGFTSLEVAVVRRWELARESLSPKLAVVGDDQLPVVTGFLATRFK